MLARSCTIAFQGNLGIVFAQKENNWTDMLGLVGRSEFTILTKVPVNQVYREKKVSYKHWEGSFLKRINEVQEKILV